MQVVDNVFGFRHGNELSAMNTDLEVADDSARQAEPNNSSNKVFSREESAAVVSDIPSSHDDAGERDTRLRDINQC